MNRPMNTRAKFEQMEQRGLANEITLVSVSAHNLQSPHTREPRTDKRVRTIFEGLHADAEFERRNQDGPLLT
jgi:hypothetical protein